MLDPLQTELDALSVQDALVGIMILASMSDGKVRTSELLMIDNALDHLPVFATYDVSNKKRVYSVVERLMTETDGLDCFFTSFKNILPPKLYETAYLLACDVVAADGQLKQSELRILEEIVYHLDLKPLYVAAIERSIKARFIKL